MTSKIKTEVVLISMPCSPMGMPSMALSLLKAGLLREGIETRVLYFNILFASLVGIASYSNITDSVSTDLVGEWIFSEAAFGPRTDTEASRYCDEILRNGMGNAGVEDGTRITPSEEWIAEILRMRDLADDFLDECLERVLSLRPRVVGFTSTFEQNVASLALARRLKEKLPRVTIVFGGGNCEDLMGRELFRQFAFLDVVVSGEGDVVFPEIVKRRLRGQPLPAMTGVLHRDRVGLQVLNEMPTNTSVLHDLDSLPTPDYVDYFRDLEDSGLSGEFEPRIPFETSRGCWWGAKHHCTFCGLNRSTMEYRSKSAARALSELLEISQRHPGIKVNAVDNILDMRYFDEFIPSLAEHDIGISLAYEVKANLTKDQLRALWTAGIRAIQPGIESLSDEVLQIMKKGVRSVQNIQLLKWCEELGITVYWNLIWGFPGETPSEYARMAELLPLISHLQHPIGAGRIRMDRYSPNYDRAEELGFRNVQPYPAYQHVYPLSVEAVANMAYFFIYEYATTQEVASYCQPVVDQLRQWPSTRTRSSLISVSKGRSLIVFDTRPVASSPVTVLRGLERACYLACDEARTARQISHELSRRRKRTVDEEAIVECLGSLAERRLMIHQDNVYLALAVPMSLDGSPMTNGHG